MKSKPFHTEGLFYWGELPKEGALGAVSYIRAVIELKQKER